MKLLLFDIDGTLVRIGSGLGNLHHMAFVEGFREVYKLDISYCTEDYGGWTDRSIVGDILRRCGFSESSISAGMDDMFKTMEGSFRAGVAEGDYNDSAIDGVPEVLGRLSADKGNAIGLLTGNINAIARMKMEALGMWHYFRFGGYGNSSEKRSDLVDIASADAVRKGLVGTVDMGQVYVIGDTRHDIECAKEKGAVSVAVATGAFSIGDLEAYAPRYLLGSLPELEQIIKRDGNILQ